MKRGRKNDNGNGHSPVPEALALFDDGTATRIDDAQDFEQKMRVPGTQVLHDVVLVDDVPEGATVRLDAVRHGGVFDRHGTPRRYAVSLPKADTRLTEETYYLLTGVVGELLAAASPEQLREQLFDALRKLPREAQADVMDSWLLSVTDERAASPGGAR